MQKEKEFIKLEINKITIADIIKLDNTDDLDGDATDNPCGESGYDSIKPKIKKVVNKLICYKCKKNKSNYFNRTEFVCKSNLRAHCKIKHEDYILVCISESNNSMALLNLFNITFNDNKSNKKLFFKMKFLYVDDSCLELGTSQEDPAAISTERQERFKKLKELCDKFKFDLDVINLETVLEIPVFNELLLNDNVHNLVKETEEKMNLNERNFNQNFELMKRYKTLYDQITKIGSFNSDFNKIMTRNLIFNYALKNNFTKIVLGNSAQSLVNSIFGSIVKGRGFTIREDIGYVDNHYLNGKISILRPMKDFLEKEVLIFNYINDVDLMFSSKEKIDYKISQAKSNIPFGGNTANLLNSFFNKQQDRSSSIVTTVLNTAEKLKLKEESVAKSSSVCEFCLNYLDEVYNELEIGSIDTMNNE